MATRGQAPRQRAGWAALAAVALMAAPAVALGGAMAMDRDAENGGAANSGSEATVAAPVVTVAAEGRVEAVPDMATVRLEVTRRAGEPGAALEEMSAAAAAVLEQLQEAGIAARDVQTSGLSLQPVWVYDDERREQRLTGYEAGSTVTVRVRDLAVLGGVLDAAVAAGADGLGGLSFGLSQEAALRDEARRRALTEALRRAALYAEAAGVPLGPVTRIDEEGASPPRPPAGRMGDMVMAEGVPVAAGELEIVARVTVVFGSP